MQSRPREVRERKRVCVCDEKGNYVSNYGVARTHTALLCRYTHILGRLGKEIW